MKETVVLQKKTIIVNKTEEDIINLYQELTSIENITTEKTSVAINDKIEYFGDLGGFNFICERLKSELKKNQKVLVVYQPQIVRVMAFSILGPICSICYSGGATATVSSMRRRRVYDETMQFKGFGL